ASLAIAIRLQHLRRSSLPALGALLLVLTLSVWVGINGAVFASQDQVCLQNDYALESLCWYVPEFSVLWRPFITRAILPPQAGWIIAYGSLVYVWLATPVMIEIARQAWARFGTASQT